MWVLDVGRKFILEDTPDNTFPPKLVIYNLTSGETVANHTFSDSIAPYNSSFLNDIVVHTTPNNEKYAYISDTGQDAAARGGIVTFDLQTRESWRFSGPSTGYDSSLDFQIDGVDYGTSNFTAPTDGIALSPDGETLYYCALHSRELFKVPTAGRPHLDNTPNFLIFFSAVSKEFLFAADAFVGLCFCQPSATLA
jgi:sugar lactone lactonase YvrE